MTTIQPIYRPITITIRSCCKTRTTSKGMDRLISDFVLFPYSNNTVLNLILNEKKIFAEQHGILYKCTVEQTDFRFMDDIDITTIFSNLLENALSASALCKTNKEVSVIVSSHNNFVIIKTSKKEKSGYMANEVVKYHNDLNTVNMRGWLLNPAG